MKFKVTTSYILLASYMFFAILAFFGCNYSTATTETTDSKPIFSYPAVPTTITTPSNALLYIANTDQIDRLSLDERDVVEMMQHRSRKMDSISVRDSLRYILLWELHTRNLVQTPADKYHAGVVFTHGGGPGIGEDTVCFRLAIRYFNEAIAEGDSAVRDSARYFLPFALYRFEPKDRGWNIRIEKDPVSQ